jgi:predicted RNA-binding protein with PUA-like domain
VARWLVKTEPSTYSFQDLQRDRRTVWDGVKNPLALKHLAAIRKGDAVLVYHSGDEKAVVGLATAASNAYPDPKRSETRLLVFDLAAGRPLPRAVPLAEIKRNPKLAQLPLVRLPRLSVTPVTDAEWAELERLAQHAS